MQRQQRPLLIYLTMQGCHHCDLMRKHTYTDPRIAKEINRSFVAIMLEDKEAEHLVKALQITTFPTTIVMSPQRKLLLRVNGYMPAEKLKPHIAELTETSARRR
jgi:uncharacterized protein YyaL (SSP411 family)